VTVTGFRGFREFRFLGRPIWGMIQITDLSLTLCMTLLVLQCISTDTDTYLEKSKAHLCLFCTFRTLILPNKNKLPASEEYLLKNGNGLPRKYRAGRIELFAARVLHRVSYRILVYSTG